MEANPIRPVYSLEVSVDTNSATVEYSFPDPVSPFLTWHVNYAHNKSGASLSIVPCLRDGAVPAHYLIEVHERQRDTPKVIFLLNHPDAGRTTFGESAFGWFGDYSGGTLFTTHAKKYEGNYLIRIDVISVVVRVCPPTA